MYPFKVPQKQARKFRETCPENLNTFKHRFDMLCKEGDITPLTSIICYYLLYSASAEVGMRHLLHILLYADEGRRTTLFNWEVIEGLDEATQNLYGPYIEKLPVPLIPGEAGAVKNGIIIRRFREAETALLQGGSADEDITNGMYRRPREKIEGGGYLEPVMNPPQGEQVLSINMEGTEGRLTTLYHGLQNIFEGQARMQQQLNALFRGGRGGGGADSGSGRGTGSTRGRGRVGYGGRGGTGAGWTRYGGETEEGVPPHKTDPPKKLRTPASFLVHPPFHPLSSCPQERDGLVLRGGSFAAGKATNLEELDKSFQNYLPKGAVLFVRHTPHIY
eukprot:gene9036-6337_t